MTERVALIMGAGDAIGSAIVRDFRRGLTVCAARRNGDRLAPPVQELTDAGHRAHAFSCDARKEEAVLALFASIEASIMPLTWSYSTWAPMCRWVSGDRQPKILQDMGDGLFYGFFLRPRGGALHDRARTRHYYLYRRHRQRARRRRLCCHSPVPNTACARWPRAWHGTGAENIHVAYVIIDAAVDTRWINDNVPEAAALKLKDGSSRRRTSPAIT